MLHKNKSKQQYLALIKLGGEVNSAKITKVFPPIKDTIDRLSDCNNKVFFTSGDGGSVGFFLVSNFTSREIRKTLFGETNTVQTSCLDAHEDSVLISKISDDWAALGFSNGWSWLQKQ